MSVFDEFDKIFKKFEKMKGGSSGYSISVVYGSDGKPVVNVNTYGDVDKKTLREEIKDMYPDAEIRGLEEEPIIKETRDTVEKKTSVKKKGKPLIWEEEDK